MSAVHLFANRSFSLVAMLACAAPLAAADFQVTSEIFVGREATEPAARNATTFRGQIVYDFSPDSGAITIFNTESGRFILLDTRRRLRTELSTRDLLAYAQWVRGESKNSDDPLLQFCAAPDFRVEPGEGDVAWKFGSNILTYRVKPDNDTDAEAAAKYREFCDWFARLNAMTNPGSLPPFARMEVNAHLEQNGALPKSIYLNVAPHPRFGNREFYVRSEHTFRRGLTASDLAEIEKAERYLVTFKQVTLENYREPVVADGEQ